MQIIVTPGPDGLISAAGQIIGQALAEGAMLVEVESLSLPPCTAARVTATGEVEILANWIGSGPWFDQDAPAPADHRESIKTIKVGEYDPATVDRLTAIDIDVLGIDPEAQGWKMQPRPETATEKKAREKALVDAEKARAESAEKARIASLVATSVQFAQACAVTGIISKEEAIAWAASGALPGILAAAIAAIPDEAARFAAEIKAAGALHYERSSPVVIGLGQAIGKTPADLDQLFLLAVTL